MRRPIAGTLALAVLAGLVLGSAAAHGYARLNAWRAHGEKFQLGYIVGYLDAIALAKRKDRRAWVPAGGRPDYDRWLREVNEFFADPKNENRPVPDAMLVVGERIQAEIMEAYQKRRRERFAARTPAATSSPTPAAEASGTPGEAHPGF